MNIYEYSDYKTYLKEMCKLPGVTQKQLCTAARMQPPFLSRVLHAEAHLNDQQLFLILGAFNHNEEEREYLQLLLRYARASHQKYRDTLATAITATQRKKLALAEQLRQSTHLVEDPSGAAIMEYYGTPHLQLIHMVLTIPAYQTDLAKLAQKLAVTESELIADIGRLHRLGLVTHDAKTRRAVSLNPHLHLDEGSWISKTNHALWRLEAMRHQRRPDKNNYQFTATICCDTASYEYLKNSIKTLIKEYSTYLQDKKSQKVYQLNVDLFSLLT